MGIFRSNNPLDYDQVDGIVIDEKAPEGNIQGVSTNTILLLGQFQRGPESAESVGSTKAFLEQYGKDNSFLGNVALQNKKYGRLKIRRVAASDAVAASIILLETAAPVATLTAKYLGAYGNNLKVTVAAGTGGKLVTLSDQNQNSVLLDEVYDGVTGANIASKLQFSKLVDVSAVDIALIPDDLVETPLASGAEGTLADTDYETALGESQEELLANIVMLDDYNSTRNGYLKVHAANTQDRMVICAGPVTEDKAAALTASAGLRDTEGRIIYAHNWLQTKIDGVDLYTSPAHWLGSIMSQTSPHVDPAYAGNTRFLAGASAIKNKYSRNDFIDLKQSGVASFENDSDIGLKLKSGITTQIADSAKLTILRRRMADFLTNSIGLFLKLYQNDVNSKPKRDAVKGAILTFDNTLSKGAQKILPDDSEVQSGKALLVDTDSLNDDQSIGEGKFFIKYKRRIYSSMRFIVLIAEIGETVVVTEAEE